MTDRQTGAGQNENALQRGTKALRREGISIPAISALRRDSMETPAAYKEMESDEKIIQTIRAPLQEASPRLLSLVGRFTEAGRIADARTALAYSIALQDIISYLFKLSEANIEKSRGDIKAEIAATTKAIEQIKRWRRA